MGVFLTIVIFVAVLFFLVTCHELGHFLASRRAGVVVEEFGLGLPPRLFSIKRGPTIYSINLIPVGAFVRPIGEDDPTVEGGLAGKGPWTRMGVYAAGPLVNLLLAFLLVAAFYKVLVISDVVDNQGLMVQSANSGSPAAQAGIQPGDIILQIDDKVIHSSEDVTKAVNADVGSPKIVRLLGNGVERQVTVFPKYNEEGKRYALGVVLWYGMVTDNVAAGSPAVGQIQKGDAILLVDGELVYGSARLEEALRTSAESGKDFTVTLRRVSADDTPEYPEITLDPSSVDNGALAGVSTAWVEGATIQESRYSLWRALYKSGDDIIHIPSQTVRAWSLIREDPSMAVVGPVGAGQLTVETVNALGFSYVLYLGGLISLGIAFFNFLPVPPLDGGGMLIALIEGIRRGKRLPQRVVRFVYLAGTVLMIMLFVVVFYSDIARLIRGGGFLQGQ
jgi:regulator of sigma E protease